MNDRSFIKQDFKSIKDNGGYNLPDHHIFPMWILSNFHYSSDTSESTLDEIYQASYALLEEGGSGDSCLDGYYYDEDNTTLYLYQAKWPDDVNSLSSASDAREVSNALTIIEHDSKQKLSKLTPSRRRVVEYFLEVINENGNIKLRGVTGAGWKRGHLLKAQELIPKSIKNNVEVELYGVEEIREFITDKETDLRDISVGFESFKGTNDPVLEFPKQDVEGFGQAYVFLLSAKKLSTITKKYEEKLFDKNVRYYLGRGRVNKDMCSTLEDENQRKSFWYGHNGITLLCDDIEIEDGYEILNITNPQIVNGCQTASTLKQVFGEMDATDLEKIDDFPVLARIIKLEGDQETKQIASELIAYRTNSQSSVNEADLRANDPQQRQLQQLLEKYGDRWFYERKRGEWKSLPKMKQMKFKQKDDADRTIRRDDYQQAWRAYIGKPSGAIQSKNAVWIRSHGKGDDLYQEVFSNNRRPCDVVMTVVLYDWFSQVFKVQNSANSHSFQICKGLKKHVKSIQGAKMLVVSHSVALFGHMVNEAYGDPTSYDEENINKIIKCFKRGSYVSKGWKPAGKKNWGVLGDPIKLIMNVWKMYLAGLQDDSLLTKLKQNQEGAFEELKAIMEEERELEYLEMVDID